MKQILWICMIALGLGACAGAPEPKVQVKTPEQLKASKIQGLRSALARQFKLSISKILVWSYSTVRLWRLKTLVLASWRSV